MEITNFVRSQGVPLFDGWGHDVATLIGQVYAYDQNGGGYYIREDIWLDSQSIALNQSYLHVDASAIAAGGRYDSDVRSWGAPITAAGGASGSGGASGAAAPNFSGGSFGLGSSGTITITHTASGTAQITGSASWAATSSGGWFDSGFSGSGGPWSLPTIPRATQPSVSPTSGETGSSFTITHSPAVSTFYHDVAYSINGGGSYTNIATNVPGTTTTTSWTPASTLFPDTTSGSAIIRITTYQTSGGTNLGTRTVTLPLTVPASVVPTVASVSWADDQTSSPNIPSMMGSGNFVQRWSKLKPTVTASGASGSTVTGSTVTMGGQSTSSGVAFANPVSSSGSVPFGATATDSRGRNSVPYSGSVTVKAYNFPNLPAPTVVRTSDGAGLIPDGAGTYLAITPTASVSSLVFTTEKNQLEWRIRTREVGDVSWTVVEDWNTASVSSGVVWTSKYVTDNSYAANTEWEVEVSIRDVFNPYSSSATTTRTVRVPTESVFMDWHGGEGLGLGKYHQSGMLDVTGDIYQGGYKVVDLSRLASTTQTGITRLATDTESVTGTADDIAVTPAGLAAALEERSIRGQIPSSVTVSSGSASYAADGTVTFTGASSVSLNDVFDGTGMDAYAVVVDVPTTSTALQVSVRLRVGGADNSALQYDSQNLFGNAGTAGASPTTGVNIFPMSINTRAQHAGQLLLMSPGLARRTAMRSETWSNNASNALSGLLLRAGFHRASTAFTGFSLLASTGDMTGTVKVVKIG